MGGSGKKVVVSYSDVPQPKKETLSPQEGLE